MKTKQIFYFLFTFTIAAIVSSCNKPGTGGDATLVVFPQHHGKTIKNHVDWPDTVFLKFNAKELPGLRASDYDTYFIGKVGEDRIHCTGLKSGQYFIFAVGIDSAGPYRVAGGISYKIKHKDRKEETDVNIAVTE